MSEGIGGQPEASGDDAGPTDAELAHRAASGDRSAADDLIRRHQAPVRQFLRRLCQRTDLADDLAQDTFVRMLRSIERYDARYAMRTWLLTIARRLWINQLRRAASERGRHEARAQSPPPRAEDDPASLAADRDSARHDRERVMDALEDLPATQRQAMLLHYQQGLPLTDVATALGIPLGTVKSHLHRGRATLRARLAPSAGAEAGANGDLQADGA